MLDALPPGKRRAINQRRLGQRIAILAIDVHLPVSVRGRHGRLVSVEARICTEMSASVHKSRLPGRKTGYRDNWLFITPGLDLREDMSTTWRLFGQVEENRPMSTLAIWLQLRFISR